MKKEARTVYKIDDWGNHYQRVEILLVCQNCNADFWGKKVTQKYCRTACRVSAHRNISKK